MEWWLERPEQKERPRRIISESVLSGFPAASADGVGNWDWDGGGSQAVFNSAQVARKPLCCC
jgi:hypothetical protein